jgi:hypothetical protein
MRLLGHKRIQNTLNYTQLVEFNSQDEYVCKAARTTEEAKELIESGFEYVCDMEQVSFPGNENEKSTPIRRKHRR